QSARHAHPARGEGAADAIRHRREVRPHARGSGPGLRGHARAHQADRGQGAAQAAAPVAIEAAAQLCRELTVFKAVSACAETARKCVAAKPPSADEARIRLTTLRESPSTDCNSFW